MRDRQDRPGDPASSPTEFVVLPFFPRPALSHPMVSTQTMSRDDIAAMCGLLSGVVDLALDFAADGLLIERHAIPAIEECCDAPVMVSLSPERRCLAADVLAHREQLLTWLQRLHRVVVQPPSFERSEEMIAVLRERPAEP